FRLVASLAVIGAAFVKLGIIMMSSPITWVIGGIVALIAVLYVLYKYWDKIKGLLVASLAVIGTAFAALRIVMMSTPIGWIIGGITVLIATGYLLYKNWNTVISFLGKLWDSFYSLCSSVFSKLFTLFKKFSPLSWIAKGINELIKWLFGVNLMEAGANLINGLWEGIKSQWNALSEWFSGMISKLTSWMPNWMKKKLGFNVSINKTSTETIKTFTDETNARAKRM
ncbi:MAG: phage tail protein, partial [Bartonella sp.]|nr:phage tail protein [Bartonella sp.]